MHLARILSQSLPPDLEQRIEQVASVVRGRTGDEISIALHDNDYDPDQAVAALLDGESGNVTVSGWGGGGAPNNTTHTVILSSVRSLQGSVRGWAGSCLCGKQFTAELCTLSAVMCRVSGP